MENFTVFMTVITIAAAALQIILFFKVWAMTNDVRLLREKHAASATSAEFYFEMRKLLALGEKEKAKEKLLNWFFKTIKNLNYENVESEEKRKSVDADFMEVKKILEDDFKQIGEELPDNIKKMKSGNEFYELYK